MIEVLMAGLFVLILLNLLILFVILFRISKTGGGKIIARLDVLEAHVFKINESVREELKVNREDAMAVSRENREELRLAVMEFRQELSGVLRTMSGQNQQSISGMHESMKRIFFDFQEVFDRNIHSFNELQREKFMRLEQRMQDLVLATEGKLEAMRVMVDEKLQKTLNERIGQSFEIVNRQLESVQKGLGEMQLLAQDVGGLKKVLSNVRTRGVFGEIQLKNLLEQILSPIQYAENVRTKNGSADVVEFAIRFPGRSEEEGEVFLPIDSKFPLDIYSRMQDAYDTGDMVQIEIVGKQLEQVIRKFARDIRDKYIDPPHTTDFAVMFLPVEGLYAEVVRKTSLIEFLQREMKIIVTGPTTLAAMLNSFHLGFRTLAIQKRSGEVWQVLAAVKAEFANFAGMLQKAKGNIDTASGQLDLILGVRTRAIERKLRDIEAASPEDTDRLLWDNKNPEK